jgi:hypothetical protein
VRSVLVFGHLGFAKVNFSVSGAAQLILAIADIVAVTSPGQTTRIPRCLK